MRLSGREKDGVPAGFRAARPVSLSLSLSLSVGLSTAVRRLIDRERLVNERSAANCRQITSTFDARRTQGRTRNLRLGGGRTGFRFGGHFVSQVRGRDSPASLWVCYWPQSDSVSFYTTSLHRSERGTQRSRGVCMSVCGIKENTEYYKHATVSIPQ